MSVATSSSSSAKSGGLESVKFYIFDGEDEERWNEYSIKTLAFAEAKGWKEGLTDKNASDEKKKNAKNYLTMSLTGKAFRFINRSKKANEIWDALIDEFAPTEEEDRYELEQEFKQCLMEDPHANPTDWFNMLDEINARFSNIDDGKFQKTEEDIKLHIRMNLPEDLYSEVITSFKDYSSMSLRQVKKEIRSFYRRLKRSEKIKELKTDNIMQVEVQDQRKSYGQRNSKPRWKKPFKGNCHYCGEQGHKAINCPKRKNDNQGSKGVKANIRCFICGKNHYANQCPLRKGKVEEANVFIGVTHLKEEKNVMTENDERKLEKNEFHENMKIEENKTEDSMTEEKSILRKKIDAMSHKERISMMNKILTNVGAKTMFVHEKVSQHVEKAAQELLDDWMETDFEVLKEEHREFMEEKSQKVEEIAKNTTWKKVKGSYHTENEDSKPLKVTKSNLQQNYYDSLSDDDDSSQKSFEIGDQWVNGQRIEGEVDTDDEIKIEHNNNEQVNATMQLDHRDQDFNKNNNQKKKIPKNIKYKHSQKLFYKKNLRAQWKEMKQKMDELIEQMEAIDIDEIRNHTSQIDRICERRNYEMRRKHCTRDVERKVKKELRKAFSKPNQKKKYWIHSIQSNENESWLADSGASVHVTNSSEKMFNIVQDHSTIVVGTGKETQATEKGELILFHDDTEQKIHLKNVLYVPHFKQNIMSIPALLKNGFSVNAQMKKFELIQNKKSIKLGKMDNKGMFYFVGKRLHKNEPFQVNIIKKKRLTIDINEAHDMFNHLSPDILKKTCKNLNIKLTGTFHPCPGCMYAKAKQRNVNKFTKLRATLPGERLFVDTSGPYPRSMGGNTYWLKIVDDYSRKNWNFLMQKKSEVTMNVIEHIQCLHRASKNVKYLRCDNAGEHNELISYCERNNIVLEKTAPNTPQHNGVVERSFATDLNYIRAMLFQANFTPSMVSALWGMAVLYLERTKNMSSTSANRGNKSPNQMFDIDENLDTDFIQPFGRMGFVTIRTKLKKKLAKRSFKAFMVGKPKHHSRDAYYMYNPKTRKVIVSRDIQWAPYQRPKFMDEMNGVIKNVQTSSPVIPDESVPIVSDFNSSDDENIVQIFDQGGSVELEMQNNDHTMNNDDANQPNIIPNESSESKKMQNVLKNLNTSLNSSFTKPSRRNRNRDRLRSSIRLREANRRKQNPIHMIKNDISYDEFIFSAATTSDPNTPVTIQEALNGSESENWVTSIKSEVNNFLKRKSWEYVPRKEAIEMGRKLIPCKWVFKIKHEIDNTLRYKTRLCVKGFHQVPGVDFTESFSPVASSTTIIIVLLMTLWNEDKNWICEMFDVEAAFLNAELKIPMYLEWPEEMRRLGFITEDEENAKCIKLIRSMYGNVDAALRWMKAFVNLCVSKEIACQQSAVDPCLLYKKNEKGELILLIAVYVDDVLIAGEKKDIIAFKDKFKKTYKITELGKLKRHLGIWFEWIESENGEKSIKMHMDDMATKIVKEYEKLMGNTVKEWATPGYPSMKLTKPTNESDIVDEKNYRSMVGKVMYYVNKVCPVCLSITRELAKYFACPTKTHWKALTRLVGYIKRNIGKGRLLKKTKRIENSGFYRFRLRKW